MIRLLHERSLFSERFMAHLFNSSEKRLARVLLLLDGRHHAAADQRVHEQSSASSNTAGACTFTVLYSTFSCMGDARR